MPKPGLVQKFTNSGLVSYVKISKHKTSPRNHKIDTVSVHCMAGPLSVESCGEVFQGSRAASSNYGIGPDGRVGMYVEEKDRSYCTSDGANDHRAVTIEVASAKVHPYKVTDAAFNSLIILLTDICSRNGIKKLLWRGDPSYIGRVSLQNMTVHRWFSRKACPGDYLFNKHTEIVEKVNTKLGTWDPSDVAPLPPISGDDASTDSGTGTAVAVVEDKSIFASGNSSLVSYTNRLSSSSYSTRTAGISCITIHIAKEKGTIKALSKMINSSKQSYNYGIANDGTIGLFVDEACAANASNNKENDNRSVNIICMNKTLAPDYELTDACYDSLVNLCEDICRRNYIFKLVFNKSKPKDTTLTIHSQFKKSSGCPGPWFEKKIKDFAKEVNERIASESATWVTYTHRLANSHAAALRVQSTVSIGAMKPYIARIDQDMLSVKYNKLKALGVVGVLFDAGCRFDTEHNLVSYRTENIYKQCEEAKKGEMPFAMSYTTRAQSIDDVREECSGLFYIISKYPPKLGIWVKCELIVDKEMAHAIIEKYYEYFVKWGLKSKCGIIATKKQATKIGWPQQCTYMPLWLEGKLDKNVAPNEELLTPSFFKLNSLVNNGYEYDEEETETTSTTKRALTQTEKEIKDKEEEKKNKNKVKKVTEGDVTTITLPSYPKYTGWKMWQGTGSPTNSQSKKIFNDSNLKLDSKGFYKLDGRFILTVGTGICTTVGTYIDVILDNDTTIKCIVGDIQPDSLTDKKHIMTIDGNTYSCTQFVVKGSALPDTIRKSGDCSNRQKSWDSPVKAFKVYTTNWFSKDQSN